MSDSYELPFSTNRGAGRTLLGPAPLGDGSCRHGYGPPVFVECGTVCVYCGRELAAPYESWLDVSIDHVIPTESVGRLGYPREWVRDMANLVTACRACNEFLNGYRVSDPVPTSVADFFALRDRHFLAKGNWVLERHARERRRYELWRRPVGEVGGASTGV
jgi:hypothetical protein